MAENTFGWSSDDSLLAPPFPGEELIDSREATQAGLRGEGWSWDPRPGLGRGAHSLLSRRSCTQVGTGGLRGLTRKGPWDAPVGLGSPPRWGPLLASRCPGDGKRTRLDRPTRKPSPSSHLPARDARRRRVRLPAPTRPFRALPRARTSPASLPARGSNPPDARPAERAPNAAAPAGPARSRPPGPLPAARLHREDTHTLHLSLTGRPRAARSRGRPRPPGRPALTGRGERGGGRAAVPSVLTHRRAVPAPSARRSAVRAMRCDARGPRSFAGYGGDVVGGLRVLGGGGPIPPASPPRNTGTPETKNKINKLSPPPPLSPKTTTQTLGAPPRAPLHWPQGGCCRPSLAGFCARQAAVPPSNASPQPSLPHWSNAFRLTS